MTFNEVLTQTIAMLQEHGRVSYRALRRQFDLDDEYLKDVKDELIEVQQVAVDQDGTVLVWMGTAAPAAPSATTPDALTAIASMAQGPDIPTVPSTPEAERRQLTVMFCDLADSTRLSQQLDPEDLREVLRAYQETAVGVVQHFDGYPAQYLGDGLLIYFGWPQAHEDDAQRGVRAGLGIIEAITTTLNPRLEQEKGVQLAVRVGLHTGPVVVGEMGSGGRHEQLALGETTNIASRLEGLAAPNTVVISDVTARLVADFFALDDLGLHELKGVAEPMRIFRVQREHTAAEREAAAPGAATLVGRDAELALLTDRWTQSKDGRGQMVLLSGEAGIGKSRLVETLRTQVIHDGATRMTFRCSPYHTNSALYPVIIHVEQLLQFGRDETPKTKFAKLEQVLATYRFPQDETLPLLATLLGIALPAHVPPSRLTPEQQRQHTQMALVAWTLEEAERRPVLVVWEDLQWLDPSSLEMLSLYIEQTPTLPILTVVTSRPEFQPPWGTRSHLTPMTLGHLGAPQVEAIATTVAGGKALPQALMAQITEKTDGVPLFVEEMTKAILESGVLREVNGCYELSGPLEAVTIPITLHDALMARLDRLATAKSLAQLGAVIGRQFSYELLKALTDYDEARLQREIAQLIEAELLYQRGLPPRTTYLFKHALIRDVAYESLLRQRRQALHGAIAQTIETLEGKQVEEQAGILAYHYARSLHQDKAVTYALLAGDAAMRLHARAEATTSYEQALTIARALPESLQAQRAQIDATLKLAAVGTTRQDITRDQGNLEQAQRLAEALADEPRLAQVLYWLGRLSYIRGDLQTAVVYARQSLEITDRLSDDALAALPVNLLGRVYFMQSDYRNASQLLTRSAEQMRRLGNTVEEATAVGTTGIALGLLGEFDQALAYAEHGLRLAKDMQDPFAEAAAYQYRANVHGPRGAWEQAMADCAEARRIAEPVGDLFRVYIVKAFEGRAHTQTGAPDRGRQLLEESVALAGQLGTTFCLAWAKAHLAECLLKLNESAAVRSLCHETIHLAEETGHILSKTLAHRVLAETLGTQTPLDLQQSEHAMLEAIRMQQEIGVKPELARSYVSYARLLQGWGRDDQARVQLTQALSMFQEMGMHWDVAQAEEVRRILS